MASEWTPSIEQVREAYETYCRFRESGSAGGEFDRMIERVRAEERERCAQIAVGFRLNADVETVVGLSWNRDMDKLIAAIRERQAPEMGWKTREER